MARNPVRWRVSGWIGDAYYNGAPCKEVDVSVCIYGRECHVCQCVCECVFIMWRIEANSVASDSLRGICAGHSSSRWCFHPSSTMTARRVQTAHDTLYSFIQSFSHHVICQSHQIILYERHPWHICPWKAHLRSLNIDPQGLSRGASHERRKEGRKTDH